MRLQRYLALSGITSRRKAEQLILDKQIKVNDKIIDTVGIDIDPEKDKIFYQNQLINLPSQFIYYALNKPIGYTTTYLDPHADKTVIELVPSDPRVFPVGRLDKDTSGLLILTNDGELTYELTHPKFKHEKEYCIECLIPNSIQNIKEILSNLEKGIELEDGKTAPAKINQVNQSPEKPEISFHLTIHEGKKRQIRRMIEAVGLKLTKLTRVRIKNLQLGNIQSGKYKIIQKSDII
jgi:23S rRNA pseudouridine2605 synthase